MIRKVKEDTLALVNLLLLNNSLVNIADSSQVEALVEKGQNIGALISTLTKASIELIQKAAAVRIMQTKVVDTKNTTND